MKKFLFIFLLTIPLLAQPGTTIKQWTFDSFLPDSSNRHVVGEWLFSSAPTKDLTAYTNTLTASGFSADFADETVVGNPMHKDSTSIKFNGSSEFFTITSASATDFVMTDGEDYTWAYTIYMDNAFTGSVLGKGNLYYHRMANNGLNANGFYFQWNDGTDFFTQQIQGTVTPVSNWHKIVVVWDDSDSVYVYKNGALQGSLTNSGQKFNTIGTVGAAVDFYIGKIAAGQYFSNTLAHLSVSNTAWTLKQVKEYGNLATGWVSQSGNVSRDSVAAWYQTFDTDTLIAAIGVAGSLGNNQEWYVTVTAKAKTAADTLDIYFVNKSITQRKRVGTSWTTFTLPMGDGYNLSATDSIAVGGGSDFDFDNVVISKSTHHLLQSINKRTNLGGYGEY